MPDSTMPCSNVKRLKCSDQHCTIFSSQQCSCISSQQFWENANKVQNKCLIDKFIQDVDADLQKNPMSLEDADLQENPISLSDMECLN